MTEDKVRVVVTPGAGSLIAASLLEDARYELEFFFDEAEAANEVMTIRMDSFGILEDLGGKVLVDKKKTNHWAPERSKKAKRIW